MNDPRFPFHAISARDEDGELRSISGFPEPEADFATQEEAREWLFQNHGGVIQRCIDNHASRFKQVEIVRVDTAIHC